MSHHQPVTFPIDITVDRSLLKDALRAILHTILFHRVFANIKPKDVNILGLTIPIIDDPEVERAVEEKIAPFVRALDANPQGKGQVGLLFYKKREKRGWFGLSSSDCWEQWAITITTNHPSTDKEKQRSIKATEKALSATFLNILRTVNERKEHIPLITTSEGNPFPYQIVLPSAADTWGSMFKRMLDTAGTS